MHTHLPCAIHRCACVWTGNCGDFQQNRVVPRLIPLDMLKKPHFLEMVTIAFYPTQLDLRGSCVALYDYADFNERILRNKSIIVLQHGASIHPMAGHKFWTRFEMRKFHDGQLEEVISDCDFFYVISYGRIGDALQSSTCKNIVHCVFDLSQPHGDAYAAVSSQLASKFGWPHHVPHMVRLNPSLHPEDNLRTTLGIPSSAIVFARHGGFDTFDLDIAKEAIIRTVDNDSSRYFLFCGTHRFYNHPQIIHIGPIVGADEKNRFINTANAMIHAQSLGETFGLSIAEFSVNNKPIITYGGTVWNDMYRHILKDKALYYYDQNTCYHILSKFNPSELKDIDLNCYREYTPDIVMKQFNNVFLKNI